MATEIERKFLVADDRWRDEARRCGPGVAMRQGYLSGVGGPTVRVRIAGDRAWLTVKGPTVGLSRAEFEYAVPRADAEHMLDHLCAGPQIEKIRWKIRRGGHTWEIDEFSGANRGLIVAEIELQREDERFERPPWLGREVTGDGRYANSSLARWPYSGWKASAR